VIEVGLGGRLDSTNIITPLVSLITNISYDHMNLLGDTLEKIAAEKAGIIKPRVPVVVSKYQSESGPVFNAVAREKRAVIEFADKIYKVKEMAGDDKYLEIVLLNRRTNEEERYKLDLRGNYQAKNLMGVLRVISHLIEAGFVIEEKDIKQGLKQVCWLTGFAGRWQKLGEKPLVIADTGHNEDGIKQVIENLKDLEFDQLHFVFGTVNDKNISKILALLPKDAKYYFVKASVPRALDAEELCAQAKKFKLKGEAFDTVKEGLKAAKKAARKKDMILIGGSTFVVGDALVI